MRCCLCYRMWLVFIYNKNLVLIYGCRFIQPDYISFSFANKADAQGIMNVHGKMMRDIVSYDTIKL